MKCIECGAEIKDGAIYCIKCGAMQVSTGVDPDRSGERIQMGHASKQNIDWPDLEPASADANNAVKGVVPSESVAAGGRHMKDFRPVPKRTGRYALIGVAAAALVAAAVIGGNYLLTSSSSSSSAESGQTATQTQTASGESSDESTDATALTASTSAEAASGTSASDTSASTASTSSTSSASATTATDKSSSAAAEPIPTIVEDQTPPPPAPEPAPEPEPEPAPAPAQNDYYVLGDSSSRYYSRDELESMSAEELSYARNEIYARNGRMFQKDELQSYFDSQEWYDGTIPADQFDSSTMLSDVELANVLLIKEVEESKGYL